MKIAPPSGAIGDVCLLKIDPAAGLAVNLRHDANLGVNPMPAIKKTNAAPSAALADARFAARRTVLLSSCVTSHDQADRDGGAYARHAINGEHKGQTALETERKAACAAFPIWKTGRGKPTLSKTPSDAFRSTFDRYVLIRSVSFGEHATINCEEATALVTRFLAPNSRLRLAETVRLMKAAQQAANKAAKPVLTETEQEAAKAAQDASDNAAVTMAVALSPAMLAALADAIAALEPDRALLCSDALGLVAAAIVTKANEIAAMPQAIAA